MASSGSLEILWNRMQRGDLVLCWQTNRRVAVGLCRVHHLEDWEDDSGTGQRNMWLELLGEPFRSSDPHP